MLMPIVEFRRTDSIGASLFLALRGIATDLGRVHELTELTRTEKEDRMISEGTEDGERNWFCDEALLDTNNNQLSNWILS